MLVSAFERTETVLVRADWTDETAWASIVKAVNTPVDVGGRGDRDEFATPDHVVLEDAGFEGAAADTLAAAIAALGHEGGYVLLADHVAMSEAAAGEEITLLYIDLGVRDAEHAELFDSDNGRSFRCAVREVAAIEMNLSIANMDFSEFANYADDRGGVFRGFAPGD